MDYQTIYNRAMQRCHHPLTDTTLLGYVKDWINDRYHDVWSRLLDIDPTFGRTETYLTTTDDYTTGTVTTNGTTTITGSGTTFTSGMVGRKFKLDDFSEVYEISAYVSATEITLNKAINDDADSGLSYIIYQDELSLPSDCANVVSIGQYRSYAQLEKIGIEKIQEKQLQSPICVNPVRDADPEYWALIDDSTIVVYPAPTRVILLQTFYTKNFTALSATTDEPLLPVDFHKVLLIGAMVDIYEWDDDTRYMQKEQEFEARVQRLLANTAGKTDPLRIIPNVPRT